MGEAFFYQKNYQAAANAFAKRCSVPEPSEKWTEVWAHVYLGKIFDLWGSAPRAVNEYSKAKQPTTTPAARRKKRAPAEKNLSEAAHH